MTRERWSSRSFNNPWLIEQKKVVRQRWSPRSCSKQLSLIGQKKRWSGQLYVLARNRFEHKEKENSWDSPTAMTQSDGTSPTRTYRQGAQKVGSTSSAGRTIIFIEIVPTKKARLVSLSVSPPVNMLFITGLRTTERRQLSQVNILT